MSNSSNSKNNRTNNQGTYENKTERPITIIRKREITVPQDNRTIKPNPNRNQRINVSLIRDKWTNEYNKRKSAREMADLAIWNRGTLI